MVLWYPFYQILLWAELRDKSYQSRSLVTIETEYLRIVNDWHTSEPFLNEG